MPPKVTGKQFRVALFGVERGQVELLEAVTLTPAVVHWSKGNTRLEPGVYDLDEVRARAGLK